MIAPVQEFDVVIIKQESALFECKKQQGEKATCECGGNLLINKW